MLRSKQVKGKFGKSKEKPKNKVLKKFHDILDAIYDNTIRPVRRFFRWRYEQVCRMIDYAIFARENWDFDSKCVYDLMAWKLKRLRDVMKDGHVVQTKEDLASIDEAIKICKRLGDEQYDDPYHKVHSKKWGNLKTKFVPVPPKEKGGMEYTRWVSSRKNANTEAQKKKERKEFLQIYEKAEADRQKDIKRLAELLINNEPAWWE